VKTTRKQIKPLVVVPNGTARDAIREMRGNGYLVLVSKNPEKVRILTQELQGLHHDMLTAAMEALSGATAVDKAKFFDALHKSQRARMAQVATAPTAQ
jgi:hypothetical protein